MLIESNEGKNFGVIIFSENKFDFVTNFTKINKSEPDVLHQIDFTEVSNFISQPIEKNLILYRLITNDEKLDPFSSKLGYFIKVDERIEVVYFDPVFVIKDIENLKITIPRSEFRFKIQQVGYRTKSTKGDSTVYEEQFSIEMSDVEAKNQNDSHFAKTMLSIKGISVKNKMESKAKNKEDLFEDLVSEKNLNNSKFYHLDRNNTNTNTSYIDNESKVKNVKEENDFFSRVKIKKERKEYQTSTLKMFK